MQPSKKFFRGMSFVLVGRIIEYVATFIIGIFLARWLGPSEYGLIPLTLSIVAMFQLLANPGIPTSVSKYIAEYLALKKERVRILIKDGFILNIVFTITVSLLCFFASDYMAQAMRVTQLSFLLKLASLIIVTLGTLNFAQSVFQGLQKLEFFAFNKIVVNVTKFIAIFVLVFILGYRAVGAVGGTVIGFASAALIANIIIYSRFYKKLPASSGSTLITVLKYSMPLAVSAIAFFSYTRIDILVIGYFKNSAEVGYYNVANAIYAVPLVFSESLVFALAPMVTTHFTQRNQRSLQRLFENSQRLALTYAFPAAFGLFFVASPFINIVLPEYSASVVLLQILSFLIIFKAIGTICSGGFLTPTGFAKIVAKLTLYGAIANIFLDILFVPKYGALGAVIVTVVVHGIVNIVAAFFVIKQKLGLLLKTKIKEPLLASIIMLAVLKIYNLVIEISDLVALFVVILLGTSVYIISMLSLGAIKKNDVILLKSFIKKDYSGK